jgi:DNA polymerase III alpha subunit
VAGLVVARQRPQTAKGTVFVLMEDEAGMINAIVRPDIYDRDRLAVRGEPFLWVSGTLAKDDGTVNVIADALEPLRIGHRPTNKDEPRSYSPFRFLKKIRQNPPSAKSWG